MRAERNPLQNRVDPFGALCSVDAHGTLMGNRGGRFHRPGQTLGARRHVSRRWICCVCDFKQRQRKVWGKSYTELFFLDEPTALAAGHRPCFECRRSEARAFMALFPFAPGEEPCADAMDMRLHAERLDGHAKRYHRMQRDRLPDGVMIAVDGEAFALKDGGLLRWTHRGYERATPVMGDEVIVLTPPSIVAILQRGFAPHWHESAKPG